MSVTESEKARREGEAPALSKDPRIENQSPPPEVPGTLELPPEPPPPVTQAGLTLDRPPDRIRPPETVVRPGDNAFAPHTLPALLARPDLPQVPGFELLGELGRGGMGVVYKARQTRLNRLVALKMVLAGAHAGPQQLARFQLEAEAVASLHHPNIVQVYEVGEQDHCPYLALEFLDGGSLDERLAGRPLPPREVASLTEVLARAVHLAHLRGIVHRDLKPANILLTEDGTPKVSDFGLAKRLEGDSNTYEGSILGTPSYMAPEQAEGKVGAVGPPADIYSLGAILYEALTGRPPFKGETVMETLRMVQVEEPRAPSQCGAGPVPSDLETICLKCLQKQAEKRYLSAEALADDLHRYLAGEPIQARPVGRLERAVKWARRNPARERR